MIEAPAPACCRAAPEPWGSRWAPFAPPWLYKNHVPAACAPLCENNSSLGTLVELRGSPRTCVLGIPDSSRDHICIHLYKLCISIHLSLTLQPNEITQTAH